MENEDNLESKIREFQLLIEAINKEKPLNWVSAEIDYVNLEPSSIFEKSMGIQDSIPSLTQLCLRKLIMFREHVSLEGVPASTRRIFSHELWRLNLLDSKLFKLFFVGCPEEVWIKSCRNITEADFIDAFQSIDPKFLKVLKLDYCTRLNDTVAECMVKKSYERITMLSLKGCTLTFLGFKSIISKMKGINSLNLSGCKISDELLREIVSELKLTKFFLEGCSFDSLESLSAIRNFSALTVLSLSNTPKLSDGNIASFLNSLHNLEVLRLNDCFCISDNTIQLVAQACPLLREIQLSGASLTLCSLCYLSCRNITHLDFSDQYSTSDPAIAAYIELGGSNLIKLSLSCTRAVGYHTSKAIALNCPKLMSLDLSFCNNLVDRDVGVIADNCTSLELLVILGCQQITDRFRRGHLNPRLRITFSRIPPPGSRLSQIAIDDDDE